MEQRDYIIFTDGACLGNPGAGGWAAIIANEKVYELGGAEPATTNNRMELLAALEALRSIKDAENKTAEIYSDSKYVIQGITAWVFGWEKRNWTTQDGSPVSHADLWRELRVQTLRFKRLQWSYVAGHAAYPGNERCDQIASSFAKGKAISLYQGARSEYKVDLHCVPEELPRGNGPKSKEAAYYLSYVDQTLHRDADWKTCEARVKGRPNAKFKKVRDQAEEKRVLVSWGVALK